MGEEEQSLFPLCISYDVMGKETSNWVGLQFFIYLARVHMKEIRVQM